MKLQMKLPMQPSLLEEIAYCLSLLLDPSRRLLSPEGSGEFRLLPSSRLAQLDSIQLVRLRLEV
jgi:hypothetical protein